jgi:hypothetical protein
MTRTDRRAERRVESVAVHRVVMRLGAETDGLFVADRLLQTGLRSTNSPRRFRLLLECLHLRQRRRPVLLGRFCAIPMTLDSRGCLCIPRNASGEFYVVS